MSALASDIIFQIAIEIEVLSVWIENWNCLVERESYEICSVQQEQNIEIKIRSLLSVIMLKLIMRKKPETNYIKIARLSQADSSEFWEHHRKYNSFITLLVVLSKNLLWLLTYNKSARLLLSHLKLILHDLLQHHFVPTDFFPICTNATIYSNKKTKILINVVSLRVKNSLFFFLNWTQWS